MAKNPPEFRTYRKEGNGQWINQGNSSSSLEDIVESEKKAVKTYIETGKILSFVIVPLEKYPDNLTSEKIESLLKSQPDALNGVIE